MKKIISLLLAISLTITLTACSSIKPIRSVTYPKPISSNDYESKQAYIDKNPVDDDFLNSLNQFSYRSASKILSNETKNATYSPVSLYMALALLGTGANNATQNEIFSTLGVEGKDTKYLSTQTGNLFRQLYSDNKENKLKLANSLWLQKGANYKERFTKNEVNNFYASLYSVDFSKRSAGKAMGKWVSDHTKGFITPDIETSRDEMMSILNTIYYKDAWDEKFEKNQTKKDSFYLGSGNKVSCDFMNKTFSSYYVKGDGFTSAGIALKNGGNMVFVLPNKGVRVSDLLSTQEKTASLFHISQDEYADAIFSVPKFSFGNKLELVDTLKDLGIKSAFDPAADFSGITDGESYVSDVKQQAHIAIDEKGVEAAAYTEIMQKACLTPIKETIKMNLNRPFIYGITNDDGALLFVGVCQNPLAK